MKILLTGNKGYVGAVLTEVLQGLGYDVVGYDTGYYDECSLYELPRPGQQIKGDIRDAKAEDFNGVSTVIHLAALSNDPLGELDPHLTEEVNFLATVRLGELAKKAGAERFIYASSASVYGISDTNHELEESQIEINPLTEYAKTKWDAEQALRKISTDDFAVVCLRPATVYGLGPSFRCDVVLNYFVASAFTTGKIEIKSDGTPWRPMIHVRDLAKAFVAAILGPKNLVAGESFNVGIMDGNFSVRELAQAAQEAVPGSELVFTGEHGRDARTYRVNFKKFVETLKDYYKPEWDIRRGAREMADFLRKINFTEDQFRGRASNRLVQIKFLMEQGRLDKNLRWIP